MSGIHVGPAVHGNGAWDHDYGGPVGRAYEQRLESKNWYERWLGSKIAYEPRAKLRTSQEQNCVRSESKIEYEPTSKMRTIREQKCARAQSKNA